MRVTVVTLSQAKTPLEDAHVYVLRGHLTMDEALDKTAVEHTLKHGSRPPHPEFDKGDLFHLFDSISTVHAEVK